MTSQTTIKPTGFQSASPVKPPRGAWKSHSHQRQHPTLQVLTPKYPQLISKKKEFFYFLFFIIWL